MKPDDTVCYCFHVTKRKILNFIRVHRPRRASQISECGGAGTGCGWCIETLKRYHAQSLGGSVTESDDINPEAYAQGRGAYLKSGQGKAPAGAIPPPAEE